VSPKKKLDKPVEVEEAKIKVVAKEAGAEAEEDIEEEPLKEDIEEEELPTREALEEVEVPPPDLTIPIEVFEEPGVVDDRAHVLARDRPRATIDRRR